MTIESSVKQQKLKNFLQIFLESSCIPISNLEKVIEMTQDLFYRDPIEVSDFVKEIGKIYFKSENCKCSERTLEEQNAGKSTVNEKELIILKRLWDSIVSSTILNHTLNNTILFKVSKREIKKLYSSKNFSIEGAYTQFVFSIDSFLRFEGFKAKISFDDGKYIIEILE